MAKKVTISFISFILCAIVFNFLPFATNEVSAAWQECYKNVTPIPMKNGKPDVDYIKKTLLEPNDIPYTAHGRDINITILYYRHFVVYGDPHGTKDENKSTACGQTQYRYMGWSETGLPVSDHEFRPDYEAKANYTRSSHWLYKPWQNEEVQAKWDRGKTTMPNPARDTLYTVDQERIDDLNRAIDTFKPNVRNGRGDFVVEQDWWCSDFTGISYEKRNKGTCQKQGKKGIIMDGFVLSHFAVVHTRPTNYTPGNFSLYSKSASSHCLDGICYATYTIPPKIDIFDKKFDASVQLQLNKTTLKSEDLTGKITIKNDWGVDKLSIESPCKVFSKKEAGKAPCAGNTVAGGIMIRSKHNNSYVKSKSLPYAPIAAGNQLDITLDVADIMPTKSGDYEILVWIEEFKDHSGTIEPIITNNQVKTDFKLETNEENASVLLDGVLSYDMAEPIEGEITVHNNMLNSISGDVKVTVFDKEGVEVETLGSIPYNNLAKTEKVTFDLSEFDAILEPGSYTVEARIPVYPNETTPDDNVSSINITVGLVVPENTKCKTITTDYVNVLPYNGETPEIMRSCIGWVPNFPSTRVEGGQGAYFYFAYRLFPTPLPGYEVTTSDDLGLSQTFRVNEPTKSLGACDMRKDDTECRFYEPFVYYPSEFDSRFTSAAFKNYKFEGPYTVGPHEFFHYRYRGRFMPEQITFHYDIIDMMGEKNIPLGSGDVVYDVDVENCYYKDHLDIKDECRLIEFYIPIEDEANPVRELPKDARVGEIPEKRIRFFNPGEHTFRVEVDEVQMYRYQIDEGEEWQGKELVYREPLPEDNVTGDPMTKEVFVHRYWEGIYTKGEKANPAKGFLGEGGWCGTETGSGCDETTDPKRKMTTSLEYSDKDGYKGTLTQDYVNNINDRVFYHKLDDASMWKAYVPRYMMKVGEGCWVNYNRPNYCDNSGQGYDFLWRTFFTDKNGNVTKRSPWMLTQTLFRPLTSTFPGWPLGYKVNNNGFTGTEWQRYQIVGGIVKKDPSKDQDGDGYDDSTDGALYPKGPVKTHTTNIKSTGEVEWVIQDEYKNHCYSEEEAFSHFGEWDYDKAEFTPDKDNPAIVCFHNHSDDFHYFKFDWSDVKVVDPETATQLFLD